MAEVTESRINTAALKRVDPYLGDILDTATHVALYTFNTTKNEWQKTDIEGALFVYSRTGLPYHGILIMNRLNTNNLVEPVTKDLDLQVQEPFLLYKNSRSKIFGIWFYDRAECVRISGLLQKIVRDSESKKVPEKLTPKKGVDIFGMLSRAQEDYNMNKVPEPGSSGDNQPRPPQGPDGTSQSVMDFFAKAKGQQKETSQPQAMFNPQRPVPHPQDAGDGQMKPFILQRLMSNPVHSVEHIEKQQRAVTPQAENPVQSAPKFNIVPAQAVAKPRHTVKPASKTSFHPIDPTAEPTSSRKSDVGDESTGEETPRKPALMLPSMFTSPAVKNNGVKAEPAQPVLQPEPLTRNQLHQAFNYLLKTDPEFVNKLHEAYVKSFSEMIS